MTTKVREVETENEGLKKDLETLKSLCMENDERVRYYQQMELKLQECMSGAMLQVKQMILRDLEILPDDFQQRFSFCYVSLN